jgi:hypothetical protein
VVEIVVEEAIAHENKQSQIFTGDKPKLFYLDTFPKNINHQETNLSVYNRIIYRFVGE